MSDKGYTSKEIGCEWIEMIFDPQTCVIANGCTCLLVVDGHASHFTSGLLKYAQAHHIVVLCLPAHTTHWLQSGNIYQLPWIVAHFYPFQLWMFLVSSNSRICMVTSLPKGPGKVLTLSNEVNHINWPGRNCQRHEQQTKGKKVVKNTSGSSANIIQIKLIHKKFDTPTMENPEKHLTFYHSKNATLNAVKAGIDNSFLMWFLLNSFNPNDNPIWSMASTNIITSDILISQWPGHSTKLSQTLWSPMNNIWPGENQPQAPVRQLS